MRIKSLILLTIILYISQIPHLAAENISATKTCGHSPIYELKYKTGATSYDYVNPNAPKGGKIKIARVGTFDSLNFLRYPGTTIADRKQLPLYITEYLFDSLLTQSADEPASYYCLVAKSLTLQNHGSKALFELNEKARFHDGRKLRARDILFSLETLKKQGAPYYRQVLKNITAKALDETTILFENKGRPDRDFVEKVGTLPIHPQHFWTSEKLNGKSMNLPLGGGPYRLKAAKAGKFAHLTRVKNYWAKDHFTRKGRFNFDEIVIDYFRDERTALEAFKLGNYDVHLEEQPVAWAREFQGNALKTKKIIKKTLDGALAGDLYLLTFNQRRSIFKNRKVREALSLLYDFKSANRILYHGLYQAADNLYGKTPLSASGKATAGETAILSTALTALPKESLLLDGPRQKWAKLTSREKMRRASELLNQAGLVMKDNKRINPETGKPLVLNISYLQPGHQRILLHYAKNLKAAGITIAAPNLEPMAARKKALDHDFDLIILKWTPQLFAGTSEYLLWSGQATKHKNAYAFAGLTDQGLDQTIMAMQKARNAAQLHAATKAFDRVFRWQFHAIPLWRQTRKWVAHRNGLNQPEISPKVRFSVIDRWWDSPQKQAHHHHPPGAQIDPD